MWIHEHIGMTYWEIVGAWGCEGDTLRGSQRVYSLQGEALRCPTTLMHNYVQHGKENLPEGAISLEVTGDISVQAVSAREYCPGYCLVTNGLNEVRKMIHEKTNGSWWSRKPLGCLPANTPIFVAQKYFGGVGFDYRGSVRCQSKLLQLPLEGGVVDDMDSTLDVCLRILRMQDFAHPHKERSFSLLTLSISGGGEVPLIPTSDPATPSSQGSSLCRQEIERAAKKLGLRPQNELTEEALRNFEIWRPFILAPNLRVGVPEVGRAELPVSGGAFPPPWSRPKREVPSTGSAEQLTLF